MRWPVLRLIWLKLTFSVSDVAGYRATGQVTSERRRKPFQLARGAMGYSETQQTTAEDTTGEPEFKRILRRNLLTALTVAGTDGSEADAAAFWPVLPANLAGPKTRNIIPDHALLSTGGVEALAALQALTE